MYVQGNERKISCPLPYTSTGPFFGKNYTLISMSSSTYPIFVLVIQKQSTGEITIRRVEDGEM
jgi:hypothetical protein